MQVIVLLEVGQKEGTTRPEPTARDVASRVNDVLGDVTKRDETLGWRVLRTSLVL